jgi:two-component system sensor histidine kinase DesK
MQLLPPHTGLGWTPFLWLIYLFYLVLFPLVGERGPAVWTVTAASAAIFLPLYFYGHWVSGRRLLGVVAAIVLLAAVVTPWNPGATVFFIYGAAFLGGTATPRVAARRLAVLLALMMAEAWWLGWPVRVWLAPLVVGAAIGGANIHFAEMRRKDANLRVAHRAVEEMARIAERERIGRDLHDLLGHTLSVIVLKSELASKLAERDPARAVTEIRDVERISREALAEVRKAVSGYRSEGLFDEIANAERVLAAAGITPDIDVAPARLPPDEDRALAFALREAVTNVVRHAGATRCWIRLADDGDRTMLEVRDNGRGGLAPEGSGLSGMRERLRQVAGTLERDGHQGTRLVMSLRANGSAS